MFIRLLLIFTLIPVVEIYVLFRVHALIGLGPTIAMILLTGVAGAYLARTQGLEILARIRSELAAGRAPGEELLDGALVLAGGVVLLTPGFCTDVIGFLLLVPFTRLRLKRIVGRYFRKLAQSGRIGIRRF
jgi:UPF0716 protein FxsA